MPIIFLWKTILYNFQEIACFKTVTFQEFQSITEYIECLPFFFFLQFFFSLDLLYEKFSNEMNWLMK